MSDRKCSAFERLPGFDEESEEGEEGEHRRRDSGGSLSRTMSFPLSPLEEPFFLTAMKDSKFPAKPATLVTDSGGTQFDDDDGRMDVESEEDFFCPFDLEGEEGTEEGTEELVRVFEKQTLFPEGIFASPKNSPQRERARSSPGIASSTSPNPNHPHTHTPLSRSAGASFDFETSWNSLITSPPVLPMVGSPDSVDVNTNYNDSNMIASPGGLQFEANLNLSERCVTPRSVGRGSSGDIKKPEAEKAERKSC